MREGGVHLRFHRRKGTTERKGDETWTEGLERHWWIIRMTATWVKKCSLFFPHYWIFVLILVCYLLVRGFCLGCSKCGNASNLVYFYMIWYLRRFLCNEEVIILAGSLCCGDLLFLQCFYSTNLEANFSPAPKLPTSDKLFSLTKKQHFFRCFGARSIFRPPCRAITG